METIDTNKVYYNTLKIDGETKIMAYKVISIVYDIETDRYTLKLNVAQKGVRTFRCTYFDFYASPLDYVNHVCCGYLDSFVKGINCDDRHTKHFVNQLKQQGFEIENGYITYYYICNNRLFSRSVSINGYGKPNRLIGTYDLLTGEVNAQFNTRSEIYNDIIPYKSEQECLAAQMPDVVEFEDPNENDVNISFEFRITIEAKDAKEAQMKFNELMSKK